MYNINKLNDIVLIMVGQELLEIKYFIYHPLGNNINVTIIYRHILNCTYMYHN